jgi:hypothetical protein
MLAIQGWMPAIGGHIRPVCPNCGRSMHRARVAPAPDGLPDLWTFACGECGVRLTEAANGGLVD